MRTFLLSVVLCVVFTSVNAQTPVGSLKPDTTAKLDTLAAPKYINQGKIAGQKAVYRSLLFPGLGQIYNGSIGKGILMILVQVINGLLMFVLIGFITYPLVWIWEIYDAYKTAERINLQNGSRAYVN